MKPLFLTLVNYTAWSKGGQKLHLSQVLSVFMVVQAYSKKCLILASQSLLDIIVIRGESLSIFSSFAPFEKQIKLISIDDHVSGHLREKLLKLRFPFSFRVNLTNIN